MSNDSLKNAAAALKLLHDASKVCPDVLMKEFTVKSLQERMNNEIQSMDCKFVTKPSDHWKKPAASDVMTDIASIREIQDDIQKRLDESQDEFVQWINGWSKTTGIPVFSLMKYVHKSNDTLFANEDKNKYVTEHVATYELDLEKLVADMGTSAIDNRKDAAA